MRFASWEANGCSGQLGLGEMDLMAGRCFEGAGMMGSEVFWRRVGMDLNVHGEARKGASG